MSGDSNKTTTTASNTPYKAAQPLLDKGMGDALKAYNNGGLVKPNTMSTVVPFAQQTQQGMSSLGNLATANSNGQGLSGQYQDIINNGGYNADQQSAVNNIKQTANSSYDMNANPGFANVLKQAQDAATGSVNGLAGGMGRYDSGTHQGVLGKTVGDVTGNMVSSDFNNWLGRRDSAQQQLFNAGQQGQTNLGAAYTGAQAPANTNMQLGAMNEDLYGRTLNDQLRIANDRNNAPLANIQALLAAANGAGSYGTQTSTAQGPNNTFSNIAGGILGGGSLLGGLL
jgi:hypothetical protein